MHRIAIIMLAIAIGCMHGPGIPPVISYALILPSTVVINAAACRIFRDLKLDTRGQYGYDSETSFGISDLHFASIDSEDNDTLKNGIGKTKVIL